jgi:hypothetical protein
MNYLLAIGNFLFCFALICSLSLSAQSNFPEDYLGKWQGKLEIFSGNRLVTTVQMTLFIDVTNRADTYIYNLVYQGEGQEPDTRNYLLVVEDRALGKFKIDEQNTVVLPMQLFGQKLISSFVVEGSVVHFLYTLLNDSILVEVISGNYDQATFTGEELGVPQVGILRNDIFQTGILKRVN